MLALSACVTAKPKVDTLIACPLDRHNSLLSDSIALRNLKGVDERPRLKNAVELSLYRNGFAPPKPKNAQYQLDVRFRTAGVTWKDGNAIGYTKIDYEVFVAAGNEPTLNFEIISNVLRNEKYVSGGATESVAQGLGSILALSTGLFVGSPDLVRTADDIASTGTPANVALRSLEDVSIRENLNEFIRRIMSMETQLAQAEETVRIKVSRPYQQRCAL